MVLLSLCYQHHNRLDEQLNIDFVLLMGAQFSTCTLAKRGVIRSLISPLCTGRNILFLQTVIQTPLLQCISREIKFHFHSGH